MLQSAALPHMLAGLPSQFQKVIRTVPAPSGVRTTSPSAPTPSRRSQMARTRSAVHSAGVVTRPSSMTKSFPDPDIL